MSNTQLAMFDGEAAVEAIDKPKIGAIAPWFGSKRPAASVVARSGLKRMNPLPWLQQSD